MIDERFHERFQDWLGLITRPPHGVAGPAPSGRITSESPREGFVGDPDAGLYNHPTIVDGVTADDDLYSTETFGPIVGVATFGDFDEAIALANGHGYGLSASIYTTDPKSAFRFRERVSAGMVSVNNSTSGAEAHLPFGGNGKSGNGSRQSGIWVLDQFTRWQALNWDYAGKLQKAQMDVAELERRPRLQAVARYHRGDTFGGGPSAAFVASSDGSSSALWPRQRRREVAAEALRGVRAHAERRRPSRRSPG